jgi:predicted transposase/invertase (TIGR01784 family)
MLPYINDIIELLQHLERADSKSFAENVLIYILDRGELSNKDTFIDLVKTKLMPEVGEKIMTIAEQLKAEGKLEGIQQGIEKTKREIAERLLAANEDLMKIANITGLSLEKIKELKQKSHH